jgi:hypothetical protein
MAAWYRNSALLDRYDHHDPDHLSGAHKAFANTVMLWPRSGRTCQVLVGEAQGIWTEEFARPVQRPSRYGNQQLFTQAQWREGLTALLDRGKHHGSAWVRFAEPEAECPAQFGSIPFALIASAHLLISLTRNPRR